MAYLSWSHILVIYSCNPPLCEEGSFLFYRWDRVKPTFSKLVWFWMPSLKYLGSDFQRHWTPSASFDFFWSCGCWACCPWCHSLGTQIPQHSKSEVILKMLTLLAPPTLWLSWKKNPDFPSLVVLNAILFFEGVLTLCQNPEDSLPHDAMSCHYPSDCGSVFSLPSFLSQLLNTIQASRALHFNDKRQPFFPPKGEE